MDPPKEAGGSAVVFAEMEDLAGVWQRPTPKDEMQSAVRPVRGSLRVHAVVQEIGIEQIVCDDYMAEVLALHTTLRRLA